MVAVLLTLASDGVPSVLTFVASLLPYTNSCSISLHCSLPALENLLSTFQVPTPSHVPREHSDGSASGQLCLLAAVAPPPAEAVAPPPAEAVPAT